MFYSMVPILALIIMFITNFDLLFNRRYMATNPKALNAYRVFLLTSFLFFVVDILRGYLDPLPNKLAASIDMHIYFIAMAALLFFWALFVVNFVKGLKKFKVVIMLFGGTFALTGAVLVLLNAIAEATHAFTPPLFSYSGDYAPQFWRYMYLGLQVTTFVLMALFSFVASFFEKGYKKGQLISLSAFSLVIAGCVTAQLYFPNYPIYSFGLLIGSALVYTFIVVSQRIETHKALVEGQLREQEQIKEIKETRELAYIDPLTGVKNKHAYVELEQEIDQEIHDDKVKELGLVIFDLNDLKNINDTYGHEAGDRYIIKSCELIKEIFPKVPIYRYGGDEFVIFLEGELYEKRFKLLDDFNCIIDKNIESGDLLPVVAAGISNYVKGKDNTLRTIFLRADERMYARKKRLKALNKISSNEDVGNKSTGLNLTNVRYEMYEMFYNASGVSLIDMLNASNSDEIVEVDVNNDVFKQLYHVNGKYFAPAVGLSYRDLLDFTYNYIVHPEDRDIYWDFMKIDGFFDRLKNNRIPNFEFSHFRYKLLDGTYRWVEQVVISGEEFGIPEGMFKMYVFDIDNIKSRQIGKISDESNLVSVGKDQTTGLYMPKEFITKSDDLILSEKNKKWCLLSIDIEHFKMFDEWFGRDKGNYLLAKIGAKLREFEAKYGGVAGYFGQDDFNLLCVKDDQNIKNLYEEIHAEINTFGLSTGFLPAFGIAPIDKGMSVVDALDRATIASSKAKADLRNRIVTYNVQMQFAVDQEYRVLTDFIHALQEDEITFYLQPQCNSSNNKIIGAEALARWVKNDGTVVPPGQFIPVLEKYGFITDMDKVIWEKVCAWQRKWIDDGHKPVMISINASRIDMFNIDIVSHFDSLVKKYKIPAKLIEIEITESAYAENISSADKLVQSLRNKGFKVVMDDFGSGYSSLNMLSTLKIDGIKLDAQFLKIDDDVNHQRAIHVLESVINMAKSMALPMIVEGVETKEQITFLDQYDVKYIQGYYFYKPMPIKDFEKIISDESKIDDKGLVSKINEQFRIKEFLDKNIYSDSMLNNVIGPVAIYSLNNDHVDIIRYNQQFKEAVDVPDFVEKLTNMDLTMPENDRPLLFKALKEAKENKLMGSNAILRFNRYDGVVASFKIHFYYIGKKGDADRFYGSATNVTDIVDLQEGKNILTKYSSDNIILVRHVGDQWKFNVVSHNLSDIIGIDPQTLEDELNSGLSNWRLSNKKELIDYINLIENTPPTKGKLIEKNVTLLNVKKEKVRVHLWIEYIGGESNNFAYILRTQKI